MSSEAGTAITPAAAARPPTKVVLAPSMVSRWGTAASVTRIMPVLYSPAIARTAMIATTVWPSSMPVRLSLVVSCGVATE